MRNTSDWTSYIPPVCRCALAVLIGAIATVMVSWTCAIWLPTHYVYDPFMHLHSAPESISPDGESGLVYEESNTGWKYTFLRGQRSTAHGKVVVHFPSPYGGTYYQVEGWPFKAMRSRVEVLDSQANQLVNGEPVSPNLQARCRWELPRDEIIRRGLASQDLPVWFHAQPNRRLALVPITAGFIGDTLMYAAIFLVLAGLWRMRRRSSIRTPHGFPVVTMSG